MNTTTRKTGMRPDDDMGLLVIKDAHSGTLRLTAEGRRLYATACAQLGISPRDVTSDAVLMRVRERATRNVLASLAEQLGEDPGRGR
jgi:hypothetical protein